MSTIIDKLKNKKIKTTGADVSFRGDGQECDAASVPKDVSLRAAKIDGFEEYFLTTMEAQRLVGIPACSFHNLWRSGRIDARVAYKGARQVIRIDAFNLLEFIRSAGSGEYALDPVKIEIASLTRSIGFRGRSDEANVQDILEAIQNGVKLPPIVVFEAEGLFWVADGRRRLRALSERGIKTVQAIVMPGGLKLGRYYALRINQTHGRRLGRGSVVNAVKSFIEQDARLFDTVKGDRISHREFAALFGFERSAVYRAFQRVGWRPKRKKTPLSRLRPRLVLASVINDLKVCQRGSEAGQRELLLSTLRKFVGVAATLLNTTADDVITEALGSEANVLGLEKAEFNSSGVRHVGGNERESKGTSIVLPTEEKGKCDMAIIQQHTANGCRSSGTSSLNEGSLADLTPCGES